VDRIKTYSLAAKNIMEEEGGQKQIAFILLDSAICEQNRVSDFEFNLDQFTGTHDPRKALVHALSWVGGREMYDLAGAYVKQISLNKQMDFVELWIAGIAGSGQYYLAWTSIPEFSSNTERVNYFNRILLQEAARRQLDKEWRKSIEGRLKVYKWEVFEYEPDIF